MGLREALQLQPVPLVGLRFARTLFGRVEVGQQGQKRPRAAQTHHKQERPRAAQTHHKQERPRAAQTHHKQERPCAAQPHHKLERPRAAQAHQGLMLAFALACLFFSSLLPAADYYVRIDGGDADACNGRVNRAMQAGTTDCAWSHPFIALPPGKPARISGGDHLHVAAGAYRMGLGAPGSEGCAAEWPWDCHMAALPSGRAGQPTRVSGAADDGSCRQPPQLWGAERSARVLNLAGSSHVEITCLEITDRSSCVEQHCHGGECSGEVLACARDKPPFGDWSGTGVFASDSVHVVLRDLNVHGMAMRGFHAGRLSHWKLERVKIIGNGWSGWDGDLGEAGSSNTGVIEFEDVEIAWNGCAERYPDGQHFGCWGQTSGGYGDGLGTAATAGDWRFERLRVHHNAADGIDLLYLKAPGRSTLTASSLYANAGNQFKSTGAARIVDSKIDGRCGDLGVAGLATRDGCRAGGNSIVLALDGPARVSVENNEIRGQGDCLVVVEGGTDSSEVALRNNQLVGSPQWAHADKRSCGFYAHESRARIELDGNQLSGVRSGKCPPGNRCK